MRIILFLLLVVCLGTSTQAQEKLSISKVKTLTMPLAPTLEPAETPIKKFQTAASFFKVKHGRVKQALSFRPRSKRIQLA
ncbi:hypothetical protein ACNR9Q_08820 [Maribacter sp. X9]|uniref:hypothetical protein n=1 Tax=Maribacter sp. X9 TaxID=3402159 RepID=UPI003AF37B7E